jgi:hypothetical protein
VREESGDGFSVTGGKEVSAMAKYTIIRIYEVPAKNQIEATNRMLEALAFHVEKDFHVKDVIREPGAKPGEGKRLYLVPPAGWMEIVRRQLMGK